MIHILYQKLEHAIAACTRSLAAQRCWVSVIVPPAQIITILAVFLLQACSGSSSHDIWSDRSDTYLIPTFAQISPPSKARFFSLAIASNAKDLVAVGDHGTIIRSEDGGKSWLVVPNSGTNNRLLHVISEPKHGVLVAVGEHGAIVRSEDDGKNWLAVPNSDTTTGLRRVIFEPKQGALIAVGRYGAIVRSEDDGKNWLAVPNSGTDQDLWHVISEPKKGALIAVSGNLSAFGFGIIVRSEDGGKSWFAVFNSTSCLFHVVADPKKGVLVAVGKDGTIVRSIDGGVSWSAVSNSGTSADLRHVIFEPKEGALVAVGEDGTIVRSIDGGVSWSAVSNSGTTADLRQVIFEPKEGALIAVGVDGAIVRSIDGGANWSAVPSGTKSPLSHMIVDPKGVLVALCDDGAIMRSAAPYPAPIIRHITHTYKANNSSVLNISLYDPAHICPNAQCLKAYGRSEDDHTNRLKVKPRPFLTSALHVAGSGEYELTINPEQLKLLSAKRPDPIYVQFQLEVPGHRRVYQMEDGSDFKVPNNPNPIAHEAWFQTLVAGLIFLILLFATLWAKPLWLLNVVSRPALLDAASKAGIPGLGDLVIGFARFIVLPLLTRHPNVLNAWVIQNTKALSDTFEVAAQSVSDRSAPYSPLPLSGPDDELITPSPRSLSSFFKSQRAFVEIIGQGGAGKTQLALEICHWLFAGKLTDYPSAAVFVDEEFTDLFSVVQAKINAALKQEAPPVEFLRALLSKGRLWVVVDRVSERQQSTRDAIAKVYRSMSPRVMLCTARFPIAIDDEKTLTLKPLPLDSDTLLGFVGEQLRAAKAANLFPHLGDQGALIQGLAKQITIGTEELPITPLLVKILVSQAIELVRTHGQDALEKLPSSVPEAYFTYVERLDATKELPKLPGSRASELIRRAAAVVAFAELGDDFRPKPVSATIVHRVLIAEPMLVETKVDFLHRLEEDGLLVRRIVGTEASVEYVLDPLAECLAAFEHARRCGSDQTLWSDLIQRVSTRGEPVQGFMLALRMNHAAYADVLGFPHVIFPDSL